jgi:hypothetical protein
MVAGDINVVLDPHLDAEKHNPSSFFPALVKMGRPYGEIWSAGRVASTTPGRKGVYLYSRRQPMHL